MFRSLLNEYKFSLRKNLLGRLKLRRGLPQVLLPAEDDPEYRYYKLILSKSFNRSFAKNIDTVIDIGCRNWSYLPALADFFPQARFTGVEVDGGRRYWNLYRRIDEARAYALGVKKTGKTVRLLEKDFREVHAVSLPSQTELQSLFCFFFPFVSQNPCLQWGLPCRFVGFQQLLHHSQKLARTMNSRLHLISTHQGHWEAEEAREAYANLGIPVREVVLKAEITRDLWPSAFDTWVFVAQTSPKR